MKIQLIILIIFAVTASLTAPLGAGETSGGDAEMQERSRHLLLNRGTQSVEWSLHSDYLRPDQILAGRVLLDELRRDMELFVYHSGLEGDVLQSKLSDLLEVTRFQVRSMNPKAETSGE